MLANAGPVNTVIVQWYLFMSSKFDLGSCHAVLFELVIFSCSSKKKTTKKH